MLKVDTSPERIGLLMPKQEFSLSQEDLVNLSANCGPILARMISEPNIIVGNTWSNFSLEEVRRQNGDWIKAIVLRPRKPENIRKILQEMLVREYELINDGIDAFSPTYPLEKAGLVVRRLAEWVEPPEGKTRRALQSIFLEELRLKGWGVRDTYNNLIYTKSGFCIIDVLDCTHI